MTQNDNALVTLEQLTQRQDYNNQQMSLFLQQLGGYMSAMEQRIKKLEKLTEQRVTIRGKQAKALQKRVQARSAALCDKHGFLYAEHGEAFRRAIWRDLKTQYAIDDIHDLPAAYFDLAAALVDGWTSYSIVRKIRERMKRNADASD